VSLLGGLHNLDRLLRDLDAQQPPGEKRRMRPFAKPRERERERRGEERRETGHTFHSAFSTMSCLTSRLRSP
jgi:hypothetical protein